MNKGFSAHERIVILCFGHEWDGWSRRSNRILSGLSKKPQVEHVIFFERPLTFREIFSYLRNTSNFTIRERCQRFFSRGPISLVEKNIYVITPVIAAAYLKIRWIQALNEQVRYWQQMMLYWLISKKLCLEKQNVILWFNRPEFNSRYLNSIRHDRVLYDCTEDYTELLQREPPYLSAQFAREDALLTTRASFVTAVTDDLRKRKIKSNKQTYHISNGVDYDAFLRTMHEPSARPLSAYQKPIMGFVGIINARHDIDMLFEMAARHRSWSMVLVGHRNELVYRQTREKGLSNIHFITGIRADELPRVLSDFDVCFGLFKKDSLNTTSSSMKLYQYLASGKPIVAYPVADAENFGDVIYLARDARDFIALAEKALQESPDDPRINQRKEYAKANDWVHKVNMFHDMLFVK